jgi:DNA-binding Lrp family transcriptional regulator
MERALDRIDFALLEALQNDARLSNKELAAKVGLAPSSCLERVRRLRREGQLRGFHAEVPPEVLGIGLQAMIAVRLRVHARAAFDSFREHLHGLPEAVAIYQLAGKDDFLVHVAVRDTDHLRDLAMDAFTARPEVEHMETALIFDHHRAPALPRYIGPSEV